VIKRPIISIKGLSEILNSAEVSNSKMVVSICM